MPAYDTYVVEVSDAQIREHAIQMLGDMGFGTKNLPGRDELALQRVLGPHEL